jgi:uncharacterized protein (DUF2147 family)
MNLVVLFFLTLGFLNTIQAQQAKDNILGIWLNEDKSTKIEIYKADDTYSGKIVWIAQLEKNPKFNPEDKNNPDPKLRNRPILGMDIITGLHYSGENWVNGSIYAPKRGIYADCEVKLTSNSELTMLVSKSGFTKKQIWTRK